MRAVWQDDLKVSVIESGAYSKTFSPGTTEARPRDAPGPFPQDRAYLALRLDDRVPLVGCPAWVAVGVTECHASLVAAVAGRWHTGRAASADAGDCRGTRDDPWGVWRYGWRVFPLARVAARGAPHGGTGKGILLHSLTEGRGMPLANRITPANGDERAPVLPLLAAVKVH